MRVVRYLGGDHDVHIGVDVDGRIQRLPVPNLAELLSGGRAEMCDILASGGPVDNDVVRLLAPVDGATEVWAAGVTYRRSRDARVEEARQADPYDRVYLAPRPELFFKSVAWRVRGPGESIGIRGDSTMDVPEPELAIAFTASAEIAGYTVCNDMSSRSIEAENPLYLPQAKTYAGSCALGPAIVVPESVGRLDPIFAIKAQIRRGPTTVWTGSTDTGQMVRTVTELASWLFTGQDFPAGVVLSTGTGLVPELGFTLEPGDEVTVHIDGVGQLTNPVVRGKSAGALEPGQPVTAGGGVRAHGD